MRKAQYDILAATPKPLILSGKLEFDTKWLKASRNVHAFLVEMKRWRIYGFQTCRIETVVSSGPSDNDIVVLTLYTEYSCCLSYAVIGLWWTG